MSTKPADERPSVGHGWPDSATSTGALVVELSQIEYAIQGHPRHDSLASTAEVDAEHRTLLKRRRQLVQELRRRGVTSSSLKDETDLLSTQAPGRAGVARVPEPAPNAMPGDLTTTVAQFEHALASRGFIGQAQGVLMERHKITADEAFRLLVKVSNHTNRKLAEIAEELARTGSLPWLQEHLPDALRPRVGRSARTSVPDPQ